MYYFLPTRQAIARPDSVAVMLILLVENSELRASCRPVSPTWYIQQFNNDGCWRCCERVGLTPGREVQRAFASR